MSGAWQRKEGKNPQAPVGATYSVGTIIPKQD
jgi:hypothetical protein